MTNSEPSVSPTDVLRLVRRGVQFLQGGRHDEAIALLQDALRHDPDHFDAAFNLSAAYILRGRFKLAVPILERLAALRPHDAMLWTNLGAAYLGNPILATDEQQFKAVQAFVRALEINPKAPSVAYNIGLIHKDRGEWAAAIGWFRQALRTNPADHDARTWITALERRQQGESPEE